MLYTCQKCGHSGGFCCNHDTTPAFERMRSLLWDGNAYKHRQRGKLERYLQIPNCCPRETSQRLDAGFLRCNSHVSQKTGKLLLIGHDAVYDAGNKLPTPRPRHTLWSVFDSEKNDWQPFNTIIMPDKDKFYNCGNSISVSVPRGLCEPSIIKFKDKFFIALRNDASGYVTSSKDGLTLEDPEVLVFDDGRESGNYCTQQHWFTLKNKLYMVYTRKGADNDHVFRHRAPLFMAEFDTEKMCLLRSSERVVVPERGARLGNFGCVNISETEAWVTASEWMQTNPPDPCDWKNCMKYGSDNSIFIAKVTAE